MKKIGKTKVGVTHVPRLLPPTFVHPKIWKSLINTTLEPMSFGLETPVS